MQTIEGIETPILIGNGTLIKYKNMYGILTAHHVYSKSRLDSSRHSLGINFFEDAFEHSTVIKKHNWEYEAIAQSKNERSGPDLGMILLNRQSDVVFFESRKGFINISKYEHSKLLNRSVVNTDVWAISAFLNELQKSGPSARGAESCTTFTPLRIFSRITFEESLGQFDYIHFDVSDVDLIPKSFQGWSGAGLWQIPLVKKKDSTIFSLKPVFSGVAFYEIIDGKNRCIRCHGRKSIYENTVDVLNALAKQNKDV